MLDNPALTAETFRSHLDTIEKITNERDRFYTERHVTLQKLIDTYSAGQREALDKAFASSQSALMNEHSLIMEMLASLKSSVTQAQVDIEKMRNEASKLTGREEPMGAIVKWAASFIALSLVAVITYFLAIHR